MTLPFQLWPSYYQERDGPLLLTVHQYPKIVVPGLWKGKGYHVYYAGDANLPVGKISVDRRAHLGDGIWAESSVVGPNKLDTNFMGAATFLGQGGQLNYD
jgi:hypothetical protein